MKKRKRRQSGRRWKFWYAASERELEGAFRKAAQDKAGALLVNEDAFFTARRNRVIGLAAQYKLRSMYAWREFPEDGGSW
jgi:hypothetical protein